MVVCVILRTVMWPVIGHVHISRYNDSVTFGLIAGNISEDFTPFGVAPIFCRRVYSAVYCVYRYYTQWSPIRLTNPSTIVVKVGFAEFAGDPVRMG